jgi:glycine/D-amino acid oxidase-like deaminating enzyme
LQSAQADRDGKPHVVIVGAGVIGCAIADALADHVAVTVFERESIGSGATGRSAGEVTMPSVYSDVPEIAAYAMAFFRQHAGHETFTFHDRESVEFVPPERVGEAQRRAARLADADLATDFLNRVDAATAYPVFDLGEYPGLLRHHEAGFLDPAQLVGFLARRARERGAVFETETAIEGLVERNGRVVGVETVGADQVSADAVVVAAGWRTPSLLAGRVDLPVKPYRTQAAVVHIPSVRSWDGELPMGWVPEQRVYFRPLGGGEVLIGGFAQAIDEPAAASRDADPAFRRHVAEIVPRLFADAEGAQLLDGWAGVDLATPDTRPIVDAPVDGPDGLLVATGFHGRGVMTAPVAGAAARARLLGEQAPFPLEEFALTRFDATEPDFTFLSVSAGGEP